VLIAVTGYQEMSAIRALKAKPTVKKRQTQARSGHFLTHPWTEECRPVSKRYLRQLSTMSIANTGTLRLAF
jgi:hypothetical protein